MTEVMINHFFVLLDVPLVPLVLLVPLVANLR
jgi:hypothetical protein